MSLKTSENLSPHSSFDSVMPEFHQGEHLSTSRASWSAPPSCKTTMSRQKPQKPFGCTKYHASMILLGATLFWRTNSPSQIDSSQHQVELTKIWVQVTKRRPIFLASSPTKTSLIAFEGRDENWLPTLSRCFFLRSKRTFQPCNSSPPQSGKSMKIPQVSVISQLLKSESSLRVVRVAAWPMSSFWGAAAWQVSRTRCRNNSCCWATSQIFAD